MFSFVRRGFSQIIPEGLVSSIHWSIIERKINGLPKIDVEELLKVIHFLNFQESKEQMQFYTAMLQSFSEEELRKYLIFAYGCPSFGGKENHQVEL